MENNMKTFKEYLLEKTFSLQKDIDRIYNKYFKQNIKDILSGKLKYDINDNRDITFGQFYTSELVSKDAKRGHELNPVRIRVGIFSDGNYYQPEKDYIQLSLHKEATYFYMKVEGDEEQLKPVLKNKYNVFMNEFSPLKVKGTISHELAHWLNDTLHNRNISNSKDKIQKLQIANKIDSSFIELDSQVHALKEKKD